MKIGLGYDVHSFIKGRELILGGVQIPYHKGLSGHSDADVLLHSICDALLGAAGLGDIGLHFPNTEKRWKNISSLKLLENVKLLLDERKFKIINLDCVIILEEPRISDYVSKMKENISNTLNIDISSISIKSTTSEGLGFIGKKKGCAAYSVCLINSIS